MVTANTAMRWSVGGLARLLLTGVVVLGAAASVGRGAAPTVAQVLAFKPQQEGVDCSQPTAAEQANCKVEGDNGRGWILKDGSGKMLRRFVDTNRDNKLDTWCYFKDGVEVYREIDTTGSKRPDQFRWLNDGGSKWGVDSNKDGTIDTWKVISAEEVSQEVLRALVKKDLARLQALMLSDADIKDLGLPTKVADQLRDKRKTLKSKFEATTGKFTKLGDKAKWLHLETGAPQCVPAEQVGATVDIIRYSRGTVLFENGGSNEWFQTGPMILVGKAWKLIDAPAAGAASTETEKPDGPKTMDIDPKLQKLVEELTTLDKKTPSAGGDAVKHHLARADILERIVSAAKPTERDPWIRQVADSLSTAAQSSNADTVARTRLARLEKQLVDAMPGSKLAGYVVFRRMQAEYSAKISDPKAKFEEVQKGWLADLTKFVQTYPKADDAADAVLQLGMVCEFLGKDVEAKNWYAQLVKSYSDKPQAVKAAGAVKRLGLEGQPVRLAGPLLSDTSTPYDLDQKRGKYVVIYYWASWNGQCASDFKKLKQLMDGDKTIDLLCINLDTTVAEAKEYLKKNPAPGTHLYQSGGLDSKLASQYGIMVLPSLIVVGKDGKCISKSAQVTTVEDEIKKAEKKSDKK